MSFHTEIPAPLARLAGRPVAIFGWGVSGRAVAALCERLGWEWRAYDEREGEGAIRREFGAADAAACSVVVHSPGFRRDHPWLALAGRTGRLCIGELDFAALFWRGKAIAVTGTNGKTTLTEFLAFALKRSGRDAVACGNNGYPFAALHQVEVGHPVLAVVEVSSFQAETLAHFAPESVLWTNFDPDHLDHHGSQEAYFQAKLRLVERVRSRAWVGPLVCQAAARLGIALPGSVTAVDRGLVDGWDMPEASAFSVRLQRENLALAAAWWEAQGWPVDEVRDAATIFGRRQHRLSFVAEVDGVSYWNDSKSTNFLATRAALGEFEGRKVHWIGGGQGKGGAIADFAAAIVPKIASAHLFGETAPELAASMLAAGCRAEVHPDLGRAVDAAAQMAVAGDAVLLSPGFASLDQFRSFADRGAAFERHVLRHKSSANLQPQFAP